MSEHRRGIVTEIENEPHIEGRRLTVRRIGALVEKRGLTPETIADRFDLTVAEVRNALAFCYEHAELIEDLESSRRERIEGSREDSLRPEDVIDKDTSREYMAFSYRLLLDGDVELIDQDLREQGHDVERIGENADVDYGAFDESEIVPYLQGTDRLILTYDSDFTGKDSDIEPWELPGVLFVPDESLSPNQIVRILQVMSRYHPFESLNGHVLHVTGQWLQFE
jgi:uncharacterized protein (DUF433 family)